MLTKRFQRSPFIPHISRYCGTTTPLPVVTSDQNLRVEFETDGDGDFRGFRAVVDVLTPGETHCPSVHPCLTDPSKVLILLGVSSQVLGGELKTQICLGCRQFCLGFA